MTITLPLGSSGLTNTSVKKGTIPKINKAGMLSPPYMYRWNCCDIRSISRVMALMTRRWWSGSTISNSGRGFLVLVINLITVPKKL